MAPERIVIPGMVKNGRVVPQTDTPLPEGVHVEAEKHTVGKENTQKIESKHINLRTRIKRLVRRTLCCWTSASKWPKVSGPP